MNNLLDEKQAAEMLNCSVQLLRKWRAQKAGPTLVQIGRCVRYRFDDLNSYIAANSQRHGGSATTDKESCAAL
jgi:Helix-turn-helix domain